MTTTQPSGTVTSVFTDIEGTRLLEQLGVDACREALAEHRRVVRDACARHDGTRSTARHRSLEPLGQRPDFDRHAVSRYPSTKRGRFVDRHHRVVVIG